MSVIQGQFCRVAQTEIDPHDFDPLKSGVQLGDIFRVNSLHRGWRPINMAIDNDINQAVFDIPSSTARGVVAFITGCESSPMLFPRQIRKLRKSGFHVVGIPLLNRRQSSDIATQNATLVERCLFDDCSPFNAAELKHLPKFIINHSAGGLHTLQALLQGENARRAQRDILGLYHTNPYLGPASASRFSKHQDVGTKERLKADMAAMAYSTYVALWARNKELGAPLPDRAFLALKECELEDVKNALNKARDIDEIKRISASVATAFAQKAQGLLSRSEDPNQNTVFQPSSAFPAPLHSDGLALGRDAQDMITEYELRKFANPHDPIFNLNHHIFTSQQDPASSPMRGFYMSTLLGAPLHNCQGEHVGLHEDTNVLPTIIADMDKYALPYSKAERAQDVKKEQPPAEAVPVILLHQQRAVAIS